MPPGRFTWKRASSASKNIDVWTSLGVGKSGGKTGGVYVAGAFILSDVNECRTFVEAATDLGDWRNVKLPASSYENFDVKSCGSVTDITRPKASRSNDEDFPFGSSI